MIFIEAKYINSSRKVKQENLDYIARKQFMTNRIIIKSPDMSKKSPKIKLPVVGLIVLIAIIAGFLLLNKSTKNNIVSKLSKPSEESFLAPGRDWPSDKKVEDYFIESLHMSPQEAQEIRSKPGVDGKVMLRLRENSTLEGLLGNLEYYGFVRDKEALRYALEHTEDTHEGRTPEQNIAVGENTISLYSYYRISEDMTAWEIANELLNNPTYFSFDEYNYLFMP